MCAEYSVPVEYIFDGRGDSCGCAALLAVGSLQQQLQQCLPAPVAPAVSPCPSSAPLPQQRSPAPVALSPAPAALPCPSSAPSAPASRTVGCRDAGTRASRSGIRIHQAIHLRIGFRREGCGRRSEAAQTQMDGLGCRSKNRGVAWGKPRGACLPPPPPGHTREGGDSKGILGREAPPSPCTPFSRHPLLQARPSPGTPFARHPLLQAPPSPGMPSSFDSNWKGQRGWCGARARAGFYGARGCKPAGGGRSGGPAAGRRCAPSC